jgi:hypothetical protein
MKAVPSSIGTVLALVKVSLVKGNLTIMFKTDRAGTTKAYVVEEIVLLHLLSKIPSFFIAEGKCFPFLDIS